MKKLFILLALCLLVFGGCTGTQEVTKEVKSIVTGDASVEEAASDIILEEDTVVIGEMLTK